MKQRMLKPFLILTVFVVMVSMACLSSAPTKAPEPTQPPVEKPTKPPKEPTPEPTQPPPPTPTEIKNIVTTLEDVEKAMVFIEAEGSWREPEGWDVNVGYIGTGFIIDESGIAVTNNHVVTGAALLKVYVGGETKPRNARILGVSECSDLAVIDLEGDGYPYLKWFDGDIKVGAKVYAVGYPGGQYTVTDGIVSATDVNGKTVWSSVDYVLQHTAKINPGNSGGPLVTEDGQVIGVNYASISTQDRNFAIAAGEALPIIDELRTGKDVDSLGINGITLAGYTDADGNPLYGIWVRSVKPGSPADKTRIVAGDIVYQLAGQVLATDGTMGDYCDILRSHKPSDTLNVTVLRYDTMTLLEGQLNGRELEVAVDFSNQVSENTTENLDTTTTYNDYITVQDNYGAIQISIPSAWSDYNGNAWQWDKEIIGAGISAAANLDNFYNTWNESGVFFGASDDLAKLGGYVQLLDAYKGSFDQSCKYEGRQNYNDNYYRGKFDLFSNCDGSGNVFVVLTAVPIENSSQFLILVYINITKEADFEALDQILASFDVIGILP